MVMAINFDTILVILASQIIRSDINNVLDVGNTILVSYPCSSSDSTPCLHCISIPSAPMCQEDESVGALHIHAGGSMFVISYIILLP